MKHLLAALSIVLFSVAFGQSNITVFNNGGQQFYVILNGVKQNFQPMTNVVVSGLKNGTYSMKLIFADQKISDVDKNFFIEQAEDITTRVIFKKGKPRLQWIGAVPTAGASQSSDVVIYRPDNNSGYSDGTTTQVVTTPTNTGSVNTTGNVNTSGNVNMTGNVNTSGTTNSAGNMNGNAAVVNTSTNGGTVSQTTTTQTTTTTNGAPTSTTNTIENGLGGMNISINVNDPLNGGGQINMNLGGIGTTTAIQNGETTQQSSTVTTTTVTSSSSTNGNTTMNSNPNGIQGNVGIQMNTTANTTIPNNTQGNVGIQMNTTGNANQVNTPGNTTQMNTTYQNNTSQGNTNVQTNNQNTQTSQTTVQSTATTGYCKNILGDANVKVEELKDLSFDSDRKEAILMDLKTYCLTASQAYQILEVLDFESDRLECAKFLSDRIIDKDNVGMLYKLFDFDSSKMELRQYISSKK
jgi:hypothetical protein